MFQNVTLCVCTLFLLVFLLVTFFSFLYKSHLEYYKTNINYLLKPVLTKDENTDENQDFNELPQIIHQTYKDKLKIPSKVYANIKAYAPTHVHRIYDDKDALEFFSQYFIADVSKAFLALQVGAHKADLFRYALLYIYGGIYLDIKTELIEDVLKTFCHLKEGTILTVLSKKRGEVYQGVIAAPPRQDIFLYLIDAILQSGSRPIYNRFCKDFYNYVCQDLKLHQLRAGHFLIPKNTSSLLRPRQSYILYQEVCSSSSSTECYDGFDRYGFCCNIKAEDGALKIKTRYSDYPW